MIVVAGTVKVNPEHREAAIEAAAEMASATQAEAGCLSYQFFESVATPNTFFIFEEWDTAEALDAHFQTAHMAAFQQKIAGAVLEMAVKRYGVDSVARL